MCCLFFLYKSCLHLLVWLSLCVKLLLKYQIVHVYLIFLVHSPRKIIVSSLNLAHFSLKLIPIAKNSFKIFTYIVQSSLQWSIVHCQNFNTLFKKAVTTICQLINCRVIFSLKILSHWWGSWHCSCIARFLLRKLSLLRFYHCFSEWWSR